MLHPEVLAYITNENQESWDFVLAHDLHTKLGADYTVTTIAFRSPGAIAFFPEGMLSYPVQPTRVVQINVQTRPNDTLIVYREIAPAGASWFWVVPCPNAQGVQWMREQRLAGERLHARVSHLAAEVKEPLLSQIKEC